MEKWYIKEQGIKL